jgi:hypothetical protein
VHSLCSNKKDQKSLTTLIFSSSFSAHEFTKEEKLLNIELELLRNVHWNFDENISNPTFMILNDENESKSLSQRKHFDGKNLNNQ